MGKIEFFSTDLEAEDLDPLPAYRPAHDGPQGGADLLGRHPLSLLTAGGPSLLQVWAVDAAIDHVARAVKTEGEPVFGMHSINSERREIVDG